MDAPAPILTYKHYRRLRFYWQGRSLGAASLADIIDLELAAADLIERRDESGMLRFRITKLGEKELAAESAREKERRSPHHRFGGRLAHWLQSQSRITWENIELQVPRPDGTKKAVRPDVFSMATTYNEKRINPAVHEVKVNRSDFLADVARPEKRNCYAQIAEVVYYAAPAGIIRPDEVPPECGLVVEIETGKFEIVKRPKKHRVQLTVHQFMNLIIKPGSMNRPA
jgi:hypothetical protein